MRMHADISRFPPPSVGEGQGKGRPLTELACCNPFRLFPHTPPATLCPQVWPGNNGL